MENKSCCNNGSKPSRKIKANMRNLKTVKVQRESKREGFCGCSLQEPWMVGWVNTAAGDIPRITHRLTLRDRIGGWKARWGINRMDYKINPGLYAIGLPDAKSPVLVTANYKLTMDALRRELDGLDSWILVLDTKGINVWCAAGKGTFGTGELVNSIQCTRLSEVVDHKTIILPQLGAPGVSAHAVTRQTGFKVVYGPVRASDIKVFLGAGMKAELSMRKVTFGIVDRLVLTPMELMGSLKPSLMLFGILFLLNLAGLGPFGWMDFVAYSGALMVGCVLVPVLLPWIPGRAFAWKGWILGLLWTAGVLWMWGGYSHESVGLLRILGYMLILPSVSAFYGLNFTGSSTYTSFSGVLKEMKIAMPAIVAAISLGILLVLANSFI